ncbi:MAG: leucine-rich repeat domain-containing protein [Clostridiales bacterium]|nr:leucine-rich repeat domain-containing protein [Clostridiales bacterium]
MKSVILSILMLAFLSTPAIAEDKIYTEGDFSYRLTSEGAVLVNWENQGEELALSTLIVPSTLGGKPVVGIGAEVFDTDQRGTFTDPVELIIPEGVVFLEEGALTGCGASIIYLPATLETIAEGSMLHFRAEIIFPQGNPFFVMNKGFLIDTRTDTLLYSTPYSSEEAIPTVTRLGKSCLDNWLIDKTEVILPDSISAISAAVFYDLPYLEKVVLPANLSALDSVSFNATAIKELAIPSTVTQIPAYCFVTCDLTSIGIPNGVEYIGEYAFYYNWELAEVILSESVQFVGYNAFPEECCIITLNPATHFETLEEYQVRDPNGEWWE